MVYILYVRINFSACCAVCKILRIFKNNTILYMDGDINKLSIANIALAPMYTPLMMLSMSDSGTGQRGRGMDSVITAMSYTGIAAFIFPIAASVLTAVTQDSRFLLLDLVPPVVLGGCAAVITIMNRIR